MADACCINAYDLCGNYIGILKTLKSEDIGQDVCFDVPDVSSREPQYLIYTDKCGCQCCLEGEREIIINTFPGEIKNINLTSNGNSIGLKWSEIYGGNRCKTMVRYKLGSYPTDLTDGILAIEETQQNQYCSSAYTITGVTRGCTYYLKAFGIDNDGEIINSNCGNILVPQNIYLNCCFGYTGGVQTVTLLGCYCFQVRGAQGGCRCSCGGKGGYSSGKIYIPSQITAYIQVGGQGTQGTAVAGGYNGGGCARSCNSRTMNSGGGGTDIRLGVNDLYHRVIVAGGGGGGYETGVNCNGSHGGGLTGCTGVGIASRNGYGGTQTAGGNARTETSWDSGYINTCLKGSFGLGGGANGGIVTQYINGGGGGWYGGGAGGPDGGAGGGSGYIRSSTSCSCHPNQSCMSGICYMTDGILCAGNTSFPTISGGTEIGHSGNGCVHIYSI